jgi:Spy/CpxP family protein refolding chaperone
MKKLVVSGVIFTTLLLFTNLFAQPKMKHDEMPGHFKLFKELNLTDQQKDDLSKLRSEHQKQAIDLRSQIQKLRVDIKDQLHEKNLDENKILDLTKKVSDLQARLKESTVKMWLNSYKLLDEKQQEIWRKNAPMFMDRMNMMRERMGRGGKFKHLKHEW